MNHSELLSRKQTVRDEYEKKIKQELAHSASSPDSKFTALIIMASLESFSVGFDMGVAAVEEEK